jgi:transposase
MRGALLALFYRWCEEARKAGHPTKRVCVAFEAGRDGFWLARWLRSRKIEAYVIHPTSVPVSREHRRAKTDRLDTGRLMRAFIGWLRGETDHCSMCAIPTLEEEDDKRPNREHQHLVGERTRIINRLKSCMARLGIRDFNPASCKAPERIAKLRTPEGKPIPPNTLDELKHDMAHLRFISDQIDEVEKARLARLREEPKKKSHAMVGIETADMLTHEVFLRNLCETGEPCRVMSASPVRRTKAARNEERKVLLARATPERVAA